MAVRLNRAAFQCAMQLINQERVLNDGRDAWSEHQPSTHKKNVFIRIHGFEEYGRWHLGIDDEQKENTKRRYKFPYGDFSDVHRCAILSAESRAGQYKHSEIEQAAARLHEMIDGTLHEHGAA